MVREPRQPLGFKWGCSVTSDKFFGLFCLIFRSLIRIFLKCTLTFELLLLYYGRYLNINFIQQCLIVCIFLVVVVWWTLKKIPWVNDLSGYHSKGCRPFYGFCIVPHNSIYRSGDTPRSPRPKSPDIDVLHLELYVVSFGSWCVIILVGLRLDESVSGVLSRCSLFCFICLFVNLYTTSNIMSSIRYTLSKG